MKISPSTHLPKQLSSSPTPPNAPSKTTSIIKYHHGRENTSSFFHSKLQISPSSSHEPTSSHHLNPLLTNVSDVSPRPLNPQPLQSHPSLDIKLSLSPITPLDHIHDTPSSPSPPQPQPPIMDHPLFSTIMTIMGQLAYVVVQILLWYLDSGCSKHMTRNRSWLKNFVEKFIGAVRFGNDHFGAIMGYGYYVFDLEVAFRKPLCYVRDVDGVELLKGSRGFNMYTIFILQRKDLVRGLPSLKFEKDHLCSACQLGKSKKYSHKPKSENTNMEVLHTLHMDLYGPMRMQSINGKKYILVIMDDYSRFTWVKFLRSKDETPDIFHQKSISRTPQQNGVVERRNRTFVEAARTMLIFSKALMFLLADSVATACYTQNSSLIHTRHDKTHMELVHDKKPDLTFFYVFGALCYPTNDNEDLEKLKPTTNIGIFEMDDPNITMEEYTQLMAVKARGGDKTFNWETATYNKKSCDDLDSFTDFETISQLSYYQ
ncbi:retrovirus-related pol polyprotein from transposon TNT 1-94 [Tanacetum coccineum]